MAKGPTSPAEKARKCFAVAGSTEHAGEREAAIARGMAIIGKNKLNPDHFEIPGRSRSGAKPGASSSRPSDGTTRRASGFGTTIDEETLAKFAEEMRKRWESEFSRAYEFTWKDPRSAAFAAADKLGAMGWQARPEPPNGRGAKWSVLVDGVRFDVAEDADLTRICREREMELMRKSRDRSYFDDVDFYSGLGAGFRTRRTGV